MLTICAIFNPKSCLASSTIPYSNPQIHRMPKLDLVPDQLTKKIDKFVIAPAVHATFFYHHLKTIRSNRPEKL